MPRTVGQASHLSSTTHGTVLSCPSRSWVVFLGAWFVIGLGSAACPGGWYDVEGDPVCSVLLQHCCGEREVAYCTVVRTVAGDQIPAWAELPCPSPTGFDWRCIGLEDGRAECREVGAERCDPPGAWGCDGTWVTYCSTSGYLGHVVDCATQEMNPVCAVREGGKAALCTYDGSGPCTPEEDEIRRWCDDGILTGCRRCLYLPYDWSVYLDAPEFFWLDTDAGMLDYPYWPFACHDEPGSSSYRVHLYPCPAGCSEVLPYDAYCDSAP
jgi:hypothetical protein